MLLLLPHKAKLEFLVTRNPKDYCFMTKIPVPTGGSRRRLCMVERLAKRITCDSERVCTGINQSPSVPLLALRKHLAKRRKVIPAKVDRHHLICDPVHCSS